MADAIRQLGMSYVTWCRRFREWRPRRDVTMRQNRRPGERLFIASMDALLDDQPILLLVGASAPTSRPLCLRGIIEVSINELSSSVLILDQ